MTTLNYQKTVNASFLIGIATVITMPDVVFGLLLDLCHNLFEVAHLLFEFVEATLDHIVEHTFHTGLQETQVIVFYLMLSMALGGLYYLWRVVPKVCQTLKANIISACIQRKTRLFVYWAEQSLMNKFKLIAMFNIGLACLILFGF
jgi:hypothetical protein